MQRRAKALKTKRNFCNSLCFCIFRRQTRKISAQSFQLRENSETPTATVCTAEGGGEGEEEKAGSLPSSGSLLTHSSCVCLCVCAYAGDSPCCPTISDPLEKVRAGRKGRGRGEGGVLLAASWRHNRLVRQLQQCFINSLAASTCLSLLFLPLPSSLSLLCLSPSLLFCHCCCLAALQLDCLRKLMLKKRFHLFENFLQFAILQAGFALFFTLLLIFCCQRVA